MKWNGTERNDTFFQTNCLKCIYLRPDGSHEKWDLPWIVIWHNYQSLRARAYWSLSLDARHGTDEQNPTSDIVICWVTLSCLWSHYICLIHMVPGKYFVACRLPRRCIQIKRFCKPRKRHWKEHGSQTTPQGEVRCVSFFPIFPCVATPSFLPCMSTGLNFLAS